MTLSHEWEYRGHAAHTPLDVVGSFISGFNESAAPEYYWSDLLYHYTSSDGLRGILRSRQIWASHARCLNDTSEIDYPYELLSQTLERLDDDAKSDLVQRFLSELAILMSTLPTVFVASFTKRGDRLGQWRMYAPEGYSLGFQSFLPSSVLFLEIEYSRERQERRLEERVRRLADLLAWIDGLGLPAADRESSLEICLKFAPHAIWVSLLGFKDPNFDDEREWRMCYFEPAAGDGSPTIPVRFREGPDGSVPYVELPLSRPDQVLPPLREVIVAPGPNAERRTREAEESLQEFGFRRTVVRRSQIPLR